MTLISKRKNLQNYDPYHGYHKPTDHTLYSEMKTLSKIGLCLCLVVFPTILVSGAKEPQPPEMLATSVHKGFDCANCHSGEKPIGHKMPAVNCAPCHEDIYQKYQKSIHGRLRAQGITTAAYCSDCHGTHFILPLEDGRSAINKKNVPETCGHCHADVYAEYQQSIHGQAVSRGNPDAPSCTDCHGEHSILPAIEKLSRVYPTNIAKTTCPECHASERIVTKYNLPVGRVDSFKDTYHGMASKLGDVQVANCASCHGIHNILPSADPRSQVHPSNLSKTCGRCHPNANENFVKGAVHGYVQNDTPGKIMNWVKRFYIVLIFLVVGAYLLHNGLDYLKKLRKAYRVRQSAPALVRMTLNERVQHGLLFGSFIILVITGFALKFGWYLPYVSSGINVFLRSTLHRICGITLLGTLVYHMGYVTFSQRGRNFFRAMLPCKRDLREAGEYFLYLFGELAKPNFGIFTYWEKMEYWSVLWGSLLMGVTGLILWFENTSLQFLPKWGVDVATLVHYLEAILATLAIVIGHLYFVIVNPDVQPMSFTWLTGKMPVDLARDEHPDAYPEHPQPEDKK